MNKVAWQLVEIAGFGEVLKILCNVLYIATIGGRMVVGNFKTQVAELFVQ